MLATWIHWLSSISPDELPLLLVGFLFLDAPRFALSKLAMFLWHCGRDSWRWLRGAGEDRRFDHCPSMCVILAGHNEAETVGAAIESLFGVYPSLEIIVVDDGSTDGMGEIALRHAKGHSNVLVLRRPQRGGKSSAMNFALPYTRADVVVIVDCDSSLSPDALWEIAQPFRDPNVGAVSATILARNSWDSLATWFQAYEYLHGILVGRIVAAWLNVLSIASGGFAAFRRTALDRVGAWDVGPPEDLDLTMRIRKVGFRVVFAPYSQCFTDVPVSWWGLVRQRLRWDQGAVVRNHCRKHIDMAYFWSPNFRWSDFFVILEGWIFNLFCSYAVVVYAVWICVDPPAHLGLLLLTFLFCAVAIEFVQVVTALYYSTDLRRDLLICAVFPLVPFYQLFLLGVRVVANTQELVWRSSFDDDFVPQHVRDATWRW